MWKIIILSALLSVVHGASLNDMYGNYTVIMTFPITPSPKVCLTFEFSEDERNIDCTCSDGFKSTLVQTRMLERLDKNGILEPAVPKFSTPMLLIDNLRDGPELNPICNCGGHTFKSRGIFRIVNENYVLGYSLASKTNVTTILLARDLPTNEELDNEVKEIDETKDKDGVKWCTKEIYEKYRSRM